MKKVLKIVSAAIVGASLMGGVAAADITNTGPNSNNTSTSTTNTTTTTTNNTTCNTTNTSTQGASSGSANNSGNTNSGSASTGSASNSNSTSVSCTVNGVSYPINTPAQRAAAARALAAAGKGAQVSTPAGAVHAGFGGASDSVSIASLAGLVASAGAIAVAVGLRKKALES